MKKYIPLLALVPVFTTLLLIIRYGVNVPYLDEWSNVPIYQKIDRGESVLGDLWEPFNLHRVIIPKILLAIIAYLTNMNIKAEMLVGWGLMVYALGIFYLLIRKLRYRNVLFVLIACLLFSPVQHENWLWGWDIEWPLCVASFVSMVYFLLRKSLVIAVVAAITATFSIGGGLAVWPVGLLMLWPRYKKMLIWAGTSLLCLGAYYYDYHPVGSTGKAYSGLFMERPLDVAHFYIVMFGRPLSDTEPAAFLLGAIALSASVWVAWLLWDQRNRQLRSFLPWIALMGFALVGDMLIAVSRFNEPYMALSTRYTAFTVLYYIGLAGFLFTILGQSRDRRISIYCLRGFIIMIVPLLISSYSVGVQAMKTWNNDMMRWKACSSQIMVTDQCLADTGYISDYVAFKQKLEYLKSKHWGGY